MIVLSASDTCPECIVRFDRLKALGDVENIGDSLFLNLYKIKGKYSDLADSLSIELLAHSEKFDNRKLKANAQLARAIILFEKGRYNNAVPFCKSAISYFDDGTPTVALCFTYQILGSIYHASGNWDLALKTVQSSLELSQRLNNPTLIGNDYNQFGIIYNRKGQYQKAKNYFLKVLEIRGQQRDTLFMISALTNLGNVYKNLLQTDSARFNLERALSLADRRRDVHNLSFINNDLGALFIEMNMYKEAAERLERALELRRQINEEWEIGYTLNYMGNLYQKIGGYDMSKQYYHSAIGLAGRNGNVKQRYESYEKLAELFAKTGEYDSAYYYSVKHSFLRDSLTKAQNILAAESIIADYEFEKKQRIIELQGLRIVKQQFFLIASVVGVVLLLALILIIIRGRRLKLQKLKIESELKQEQLKRENEIRLNEDRRRISKELHDSIGANLTILKESVSKIRNGEDSRTKDVMELTDETIRELRKSVWLLNNKETDIEEWVVKLREYFRFVPILKIKYESQTEDSVQLQSSMLTGLFRVMQEAVNNALKHSRCNSIVVLISRNANILSIEIEDDGTGFDFASDNGGFGIKSMTERVHQMNGRIDFRSDTSAGAGTKINIVVVLNETGTDDGKN